MKETNNQAPLSPSELHLLTAAHFQSLLGQIFRIAFTDEMVAPAELVGVTELTSYPGQERKPFSILLQTELRSNYYPQAIYTTEHTALGTLQLFLVPVGANGQGVQYEAVFS